MLNERRDKGSHNLFCMGLVNDSITSFKPVFDFTERPNESIILSWNVNVSRNN